MRKSFLQLYAPFLALAVVQALLIAVAPSRGPGSQAVGALGAPAIGGDEYAQGIDPTTGATVAGATAVNGAGTSSRPGGGGTTGGATAGSAGTGGTAGAGAGSGGGGAAAGDTSHCKGPFQHDVIQNNRPPCAPKFAGDNGGATYQGVTADKIKVIVFEAEPNDQVNAILGAKGLAVTTEQRDAFYTAAFNFINKRYELYGRQIDWEVVVGDCPTTPPDYDKCNAAAQEVVKKKPALVVWVTSLYASVFDIWANAGIPSIGGSSFSREFYTDRRPYRYEVGMDGTSAADQIAEYYCKKMSGQNASHSGQVIHPQIGARDAVPRKLGIVVPEIPANTATAQRVASKVGACGGGEVPIFTYESDIERATEQTQATVEGLISQKVTTVSCMCDPIAPVFLSQGMANNGYFPEFLLPGLGLLDYDLLGQLYDKRTMAHAFGPSNLAQPLALDDGDPARVWRAEGNSGHACGNNGCGLHWAFANAAGIAIQAAGPIYNPLNLEAGVLSLPPNGGWEATGGNPAVALYKYGPGDYNGVSDAREVYWSESATTPVDGTKGAYVNVNGGRRYELGKWPANGLAGIPVSPN